MKFWRFFKINVVQDEELSSHLIDGSTVLLLSLFCMRRLCSKRVPRLLKLDQKQQRVNDFKMILKCFLCIIIIIEYQKVICYIK